ncbi:HutD family protein [Arthrobacter sp. SLBN-112]|uniref:HutD/Ves family protein n=1 Tax=Arthrobacter sp. SLBN-112 TaxID=2768452 RepID=UPI0027B6E27D|nr:HutD family protein [Arthrobacter sp. SLBN-112]MDQ0799581.1 environmental stress-induced protein Ves [Arthrobacter sp. SLBN-112]
MQIIRFAELKAEPWRNGGGVTREIARQDAAGGGWDWRVSIADVTKAGDFSEFPGMERVLTVIDGELLLLTVDGAEQPVEKYRPFRFDGGAATTGSLPTGDIRDLNVITRAAAYKGYTSILELSKKRAHPVFEGQLAVLLQGQAMVSEGGSDQADSEPLELGRYDAVAGSDANSPGILGRGFLAVVSINPVEPAT